jgi:hypothetical protein
MLSQQALPSPLDVLIKISLAQTRSITTLSKEQGRKEKEIVTLNSFNNFTFSMYPRDKSGKILESDTQKHTFFPLKNQSSDIHLIFSQFNSRRNWCHTEICCSPKERGGRGGINRTKSCI